VGKRRNQSNTTSLTGPSGELAFSVLEVDHVEHSATKPSVPDFLNSFPALLPRHPTTQSKDIVGATVGSAFVKKCDHGQALSSASYERQQRATLATEKPLASTTPAPLLRQQDSSDSRRSSSRSWRCSRRCRR